MASTLFIMNDERRELKGYIEEFTKRLEDFDDLEKNLYPEIKDIVEGNMGYDCCVGLVQNEEARYYNAFRAGALKDGKILALVEVKFASATPTGDYKVTRLTPDGKTKIEHEMCGRGDLMDIIESMLARSLEGASEAKAADEDSENVADAQECKAALDKYVLDREDMKEFKLKTALTKDIRTGAEMPASRVELGVRKDKKLEPYITFDFSYGMCHINFHLVKEDWDENLNDFPSVKSMVRDLVPDITKAIKAH